MISLTGYYFTSISGNLIAVIVPAVVCSILAIVLVAFAIHYLLKYHRKRNEEKVSNEPYAAFENDLKRVSISSESSGKGSENPSYVG